MKKKFVFAAVGAAVVAICGVIVFTRNSNPVYRIAISNIESMTQGEGILLKTCYFYGYDSDEWGSFVECEDNTINPGEGEGNVYGCKSARTMRKGTASYCY